MNDTYYSCIKYFEWLLARQDNKSLRVPLCKDCEFGKDNPENKEKSADCKYQGRELPEIIK